MTTSSNPKLLAIALSIAAALAAIDKRIDANRAGANDKALENALFRARGFAQLRRDQADEAARMSAARHARPIKPRKCPTCGAHTLYASARA